jgi:hypothetical protein
MSADKVSVVELTFCLLVLQTQATMLNGHHTFEDTTVHSFLVDDGELGQEPILRIRISVVIFGDKFLYLKILFNFQ